MRNLIINLKYEQYKELINLARNYHNEKFAVMEADLIGNNIYITNIEVFGKNNISFSNSKVVEIDTDYLYSKIVEAKQKREKVLITMHTHPGHSGIAKMSTQDINAFSAFNKILSNKIIDMLAIDAVVSPSEVSFYCWNSNFNLPQKLNTRIYDYEKDDSSIEHPKLKRYKIKNRV